MANDIVSDVVAVGLGAVKGFVALAGIALGLVIAKFGIEIVIDVINAGVEIIKAIIA